MKKNIKIFRYFKISADDSKISFYKAVSKNPGLNLNPMEKLDYIFSQTPFVIILEDMDFTNKQNMRIFNRCLEEQKNIFFKIIVIASCNSNIKTPFEKYPIENAIQIKELTIEEAKSFIGESVDSNILLGMYKFTKGNIRLIQQIVTSFSLNSNANFSERMSYPFNSTREYELNNFGIELQYKTKDLSLPSNSLTVKNKAIPQKNKFDSDESSFGDESYTSNVKGSISKILI